MSSVEGQASAEGSLFQLGQDDRCPASSLTLLIAAALFSTDLNLTTRGTEKPFSYFSEQISGIIPLYLLPAEVSCSFSLHRVMTYQVFVTRSSA